MEDSATASSVELADANDNFKGTEFNKDTDLSVAAAAGIDLSHYGDDASATDFLDEEDEKNQPICYMGGKEGLIDETWPVKECCRIYADALFRGRYQDFCVYGTGNVANTKNVFMLAYEYHAWEQEITAYKCGDEVGITFFYDSGADNIMDSGGPGSSNWKLDHSDTARALRVKKEDNPPFSGTLYNRKGCHGRSHVIKTETTLTGDSFGDSGRVYDDPEDWKSEKSAESTTWDPMSVWLNNGTEIEMYQVGEFDGPSSLIVKRKPDAPLMHGRSGKCYNFADVTPNLKVDGGYNWNSLHFRGYVDLLDE